MPGNIGMAQEDSMLLSKHRISRNSSAQQNIATYIKQSSLNLGKGDQVGGSLFRQLTPWPAGGGVVLCHNCQDIALLLWQSTRSKQICQPSSRTGKCTTACHLNVRPYVVSMFLVHSAPPLFLQAAVLQPRHLNPNPKPYWGFPKLGVPSWVLIIRESYYLGFFGGSLIFVNSHTSPTPNPKPQTPNPKLALGLFQSQVLQAGTEQNLHEIPEVGLGIGMLGSC